MAPSSSDVGIFCTFLLLSMFSNFCVGIEPSAASKKLSRGWGDHIHWQTLSQGLDLAGKINKPIMIIIHKTWCNACKKLKSKFAKSKEIGELSRNFIMVNTEDDEEPPEPKYAPDGSYIPRILFVDGKENVKVDYFNEVGNPKYRFYYPSEHEVILTMRNVANIWPYKTDDTLDAEGGQVYDEL